MVRPPGHPDSTLPIPEPWASMSEEAARAALPAGPRVGVVHDWLNGMRGGEKVLEVLLELFPGAPVYTLFYQPGRVSEAIRAHPVRTSWLNGLPGSAKYYRHLLPLMPLVMSTPKWRAGEIDLVVSTSACVAKASIPPPGVPHFCYCHAPMRYVWDQFDEYFGPGRGSAASRLAMRALRGPLQRWDVRTSARVTQFLCNARNIARRIGRFYGRDAVLAPPPVDAARFTPLPPGERADGPWLVVSALVPYKRVDLAIRACARRGEPMTLAGRGPEMATLRALAAKLGAEVTFRDWVGDEELADLMRRTRGLLFPGEEDFGITPLEAMAAGRPVVALARGGALETVLEGETGVFFDGQEDEESLAEAMSRCDAVAWDAERLRRHSLGFDRPACRLRLARALAWLYSVHRFPPHGHSS